MKKIIIRPKKITKKNFSSFGDLITTKKVNYININNGYAKRYDNIVKLNTSNKKGKTTLSIFSALKRKFPMKIDMMEKHPLGSQAFIPMKETKFLTLVAPKGKKPNIKKIKAFIISKGLGINYNPGIWHFPLISIQDMNFLVVDRKGQGKNLIIENLSEKNIFLNY